MTHRVARSQDVVLEQSPAPGEWLYAHDRRRRVVGAVEGDGARPQRARVGRRDRQAEARRFRRRRDPRVQPGRAGRHGVLPVAERRRDPPAGSEGSLQWSDGPPPQQVPDVHGFSCAAAKAAIEAKHLVGTCKEVFHDTVLAGQVIRTLPPADTSLKQGITVTIEVSKGPQLVKVPDVTGRKVNDAINKLKALGFKTAVPNYNSKGHVFEQSPAPNRMVPKGSVITLIL